MTKNDVFSFHTMTVLQSLWHRYKNHVPN